jgi:hypothetical protein
MYIELWGFLTIEKFSPFPSLAPIMKIARSLILKVQKMGTQDEIHQFTHEASKEISLP